MYEGLVRSDIMGIKIPNSLPLSEVHYNILSYAERHNIPLVRIKYPEVKPKKVECPEFKISV